MSAHILDYVRPHRGGCTGTEWNFGNVSGNSMIHDHSSAHIGADVQERRVILRRFYDNQSNCDSFFRPHRGGCTGTEWNFGNVSGNSMIHDHSSAYIGADLQERVCDFTEILR